MAGPRNGEWAGVTRTSGQGVGGAGACVPSVLSIELDFEVPHFQEISCG